MCSGAKRWEEKQPMAAQALKEIAEAYAQQDPSFKTAIAIIHSCPRVSA